MNRLHRRSALGGAMMLAAAAVTAGISTGNAVAAGDQETPAPRIHTHTTLTALNNSNVTGRAAVDVMNRRLHIDVDAYGVLKGMPHAQHIHFGARARNECPSAAKDDANNDFRINTTEGAPAYGPIKVSLTTMGATGPGSALAVDRFPTAPRGEIHYDRFTRTKAHVARAIRRGNAAVVIHGIDYNGNGKYDFEGAGASELDANLPAEATDPIACGVLKRR